MSPRWLPAPLKVVRKAHVPAGANNGPRKMRPYSAEEWTMFSPPPSHPPEAEFAKKMRSLPVSRDQPKPSERPETFDRMLPSVAPGTSAGEAGGYSEVVRETMSLPTGRTV